MEADEMHSQARAVVERQRKLRLTPLHRHGVRRLRLLMRVRNWFQNRNPPAVGETIDRSIPGSDGDLPIRIYRPRGSGAAPTVVFFHGGGFLFGSLESHDLFCRHLTRASGCVTVSVDYRLAPEHPFPAAVEDAYRAVEWTAANPDSVGGNGRVAVAGDSAGGTLAAVAALMAAERDGPDLDYQVLLYPAVGVDEDQDSVRNHAGIVLSKGDLEWMRDAYYGSDVHLRNPYADPSNACDLSGVAPATVVTAGFDPLRDGGRAYAEQLVGDGVPVRYANYPAMIHGFATSIGGSTGIDRAHDAIEAVAADLRGALGLSRSVQ